MKRTVSSRLLALLLALCMTLSLMLTGCGDKRNTDGEAPAVVWK